MARSTVLIPFLDDRGSNVRLSSLSVICLLIYLWCSLPLPSILFFGTVDQLS